MNTAQLITAAVAIVSVVGAIIAGAWLNQRALERQFEAFRNEVAAQFGTVRAEIKAGNDRTERIERQLDQLFKPVLPGRSGD